MSTSDDDAIVLNYKGKTIFDSASYYCPYIPLVLDNVVKTKMEFKCKDLGDNRWHCYVTVPTELDEEFIAWVRNTMEDRVMIKIAHTNINGAAMNRTITYTYELRGGNIGDRTVMLLRWNNANA
jgi:hypothetical protein